MSRTREFNIARKTGNLDIPYFVGDSFTDKFSTDKKIRKVNINFKIGFGWLHRFFFHKTRLVPIKSNIQYSKSI